ncbi:MAG: hypothetical protein JJT94_07800 [Bernardetiaceae bacterium]|nr:hypothetical protein [Bernardetiaceae bacterium]
MNKFILLVLLLGIVSTTLPNKIYSQNNSQDSTYSENKRKSLRESPEGFNEVIEGMDMSKREKRMISNFYKKYPHARLHENASKWALSVHSDMTSYSSFTNNFVWKNGIGVSYSISDYLNIYPYFQVGAIFSHSYDGDIDPTIGDTRWNPFNIHPDTYENGEWFYNSQGFGGYATLGMRVGLIQSPQRFRIFMNTEASFYYTSLTKLSYKNLYPAAHSEQIGDNTPEAKQSFTAFNFATGIEAEYFIPNSLVSVFALPRLSVISDQAFASHRLPPSIPAERNDYTKMTAGLSFSIGVRISIKSQERPGYHASGAFVPQKYANFIKEKRQWHAEKEREKLKNVALDKQEEEKMQYAIDLIAYHTPALASIFERYKNNPNIDDNNQMLEILERKLADAYNSSIIIEDFVNEMEFLIQTLKSQQKNLVQD